MVPRIDGEWWQVAGDPDLGPLTDPKQQPVDFAVWQAADGSWQLWSCIRHTRCGGKTRLFHRWEGSVYCSKDPLSFGVEDDRQLVCRLPVAAPEIIEHGGRHHIAALLPSLKGIRIARLAWVP